jgi:hypothetical protein
MRLALVLSLVGLVLICPSICGAADENEHDHHQQTADPHDTTPVHCPDEGASCVCAGAVRPADLRSDHLEVAGLLTPTFLDLSFAPHLSTGSPALSAHLAMVQPLVGSPAARAWLQNYQI